MKNHVYLLFTFLTVISVTRAIAQISVSYPLENCVFQRDQDNRATIYIAGNFTEFLDVIEVKFSPVQAGWGQESDWMSVQNNPASGFFNTSIDWTGGWYRLEVRGRRGDQVIGTAAINRVGIGEVFLIAGQSNAQGFFDKGAQSASDERVLHAEYDGTFGPNQPLPYPSFSHLQSGDVISPRGKSSWFWGKLGDALISRLHVPVLFYNVAWEGSGVNSWKQSISGTAWSAYNSSIPFEPSGMPYANLRNVMRNYVAITGIRSVLWVQGEADNDVGTSQNDYYSALETVINQTRNEFSKNLSWVVARVSYTTVAGHGDRITNAQNQIINNLSNVFAGPEMDQIQVPRPDGYHLHDGGLITAANAWDQSLGVDFFARSVPYKSIAPIRLSTSCDHNNITLHTEGGFHSYRWSNGNTNPSITPGEGEYQLSAYDQDGNFRFSPRFRIPGNVGNITPPSVSSVGNAEVCEGGSLTLVSSIDRNPIWNTGHNGRQVQVSSPGEYNVSIENVFGCRSTSANFTVARSNKPLPASPVITANRSAEICDGEEVTLSANTGNNTFWSNGVNNQSSTNIRNGGQYTARTRDSEGCFSNPSNSISVHVNALPAKPVVTSGSPTTFCAGGEVSLKSSYNEGNTWSDNSTAQSIVVRQSGEFRVTISDSKGCKNTSDAVRVTVNPLPSPPVVSAQRPLSFCQGDYTRLTSNPQHSYQWNTGSTGREIDIDRNGEYWLKTTDQNGCTSGNSNTLVVKVNPLPAQPTITVSGNTTFCENEQVVLEAPPAPAYSWSNGSPDQRLVVNVAGHFTLQTINEFGCRSPQSEAIYTQTLPIPAPPVISANGPTVICDNSEVALSATGAAPFLWSTEDSAPEIKANKSGTFFARSVGGNGCISDKSNLVEVETKKTPEKPILAKKGVFSLYVTNIMEGSVYNWTNDSQPIPEKQTDMIRISRSGQYSAQAFFRYSDQLTCYSDYSDPAFFEVVTGSGRLILFPNPTQDGKVMIETAEILSNTTVSVFSLQGKKVASFHFDQVSVPVEIEIPRGVPGVYIVQVNAVNFSASQKLIVMY